MILITETIYHLSVPFRIALLTDLHNHPFSDIHASLQAHCPEIICIAGDVAYGGMPGLEDYLVEVQEHVLPFLRMCAAAAPTFLSLGNHELTFCDGDLLRIRDSGVCLLDNTWTEYRGVFIGGLTSHRVLQYRRFRLDKTERYPKQRHIRRLVRDPDTGWLDVFEQLDGYRILLSHHPEYYPKYLCSRDLDLILSGHAHGGQWRIGGRGLYAPGQGLFPSLTSGVHENRLVVSRGLSNTAPVPRLHNPAEIVYLDPWPGNS